MGRYKVLETSYVGDRVVSPGEEVEFDHDPGFNLAPLDDAAKQRRANFERASTGRRLAPTDPLFISEMMKRNLEEGVAKGVGAIPAGPMGENGPNSVVPPPTSGMTPPVPSTDRDAAAAAEQASAKAWEEAGELARAETAELKAGHQEEVTRIHADREAAEKRAQEAETRAKELQAQLDAQSGKTAGKK